MTANVVGSADPQMFVRRAVVDDAVVLEALERDARNALIPVRGGARRLAEVPAYAMSWSQHLDRRDVAVVIAGLDDVAFAWLSVQDPDEHGAALIDSVYVQAGARQLGLGDAMVEWAVEWARQRGAQTIESWALPGDRETKNLFERNGLTARLITVSRSLSDPASSADASQ
jgi:GNAT superfamily N-acetyltransferase